MRHHEESNTLEAEWHATFGGLTECELLDLLQSVAELRTQLPTAINIPAHDSLSGLTSPGTSARPQTLTLNTDTLGDSGLPTRSTSTYRLATLSTRPMGNEYRRWLQNSRPSSTTFPLIQTPLPNPSQLTPLASPSVSEGLSVEPLSMGRNRHDRRGLNFSAPPITRKSLARGSWKTTEIRVRLKKMMKCK